MGQTNGRQWPLLPHRKKNATVNGGALLAPGCHMRLLLSIEVAKVMVMTGRLHERQMVHCGVKFIVNHHQLSKVAEPVNVSNPLA